MPFDPAVRRDTASKRRGGGAAERAPGGRRDAAANTRIPPFFLYVEGPRDGDLLRVWARRLSPQLARSLEDSLVILGGRQPARAVEHFRGAGGVEGGVRGLVVLDRDHHGDRHAAVLGDSGLELFVWGRRHIESYVLVRAAIQRAVGARDAVWAERVIASHVPEAGDELACRDLDAKRLLAARGALARDLGSAISPAAIARTMRPAELHEDVLRLFERIREALGLTAGALEVVRRSPAGRA